MKQLRTSLALALSLVLVLTGNAMAHARAMTAPTGEMVICTGSGPVMVTVDAEGQPTGQRHFCPDGALALLAALDISFELTAQPVTNSTRIAFIEPATLLSRKLLAAAARGPPAKV